MHVLEGGIPDEKTQRAVPHPVSGAVGRTSGAGHRKRRYVCRAGRNQVSIAAKQQELQSLKNQLAAQVTENAELSGTLDQGEDAIIERYAREQGYAKPNERVFVDISGK